MIPSTKANEIAQLKLRLQSPRTPLKESVCWQLVHQGYKIGSFQYDIEVKEQAMIQ